MNDDMKWIEKRNYPRLEWGFMVRFKLKDDEKAIWNSSAIKNIGEGGCLFATDVKFQIGDVLEIKIQFPMYKEPLHLFGKVTRVSRGIAVRFLGMDNSAQTELRAAINFFLKKQQRDYRIT
ncbi:PilZ domain-containing protein [Thermoproteota archaeon]